MRGKSHLIVGILVIIFLLNNIEATVAEAGVTVVSSRLYRSTGDLIGAWHWLRRDGHRTTWRFRGLPKREIYLNFTLLCTNKVNGGSGYGEEVRVIISPSGMPAISTSVKLINPFRPQYPHNTHGRGYSVYGAVKVVLKPNTPFAVTIYWPGVNRYHVATRKEGLKVAYVE